MTVDRRLTDYELEVGLAMTARRDAALALRDAIDHDVSRYQDGMDQVRAGRAMDILDPTTAGEIRQAMTELVSEFEACRHRFRLALVAVAVDNGLTAREIGTAFQFSRQLAGRYLREAFDRWPELDRQTSDEAAADASPAQAGPATTP